MQGKYENSYVRTALLYQKGQNIGFYMIVVLVFQGLSEILFYSQGTESGSVPTHTSFHLFINSPLRNNIVHSLGLKTDSRIVTRSVRCNHIGTRSARCNHIETRSARCNHIETERKFLLKVNDINWGLPSNFVSDIKRI